MQSSNKQVSSDVSLDVPGPMTRSDAGLIRHQYTCHLATEARLGLVEAGHQTPTNMRISSSNCVVTSPQFPFARFGMTSFPSFVLPTAIVDGKTA
jgi:hypothetical protein